MACPATVSNHINSITSEGIIMRLLTCLTSDENVYNYAVLEKNEDYDTIIYAIGEELDSRIAYYFEHDEVIEFDDVDIVEIIETVIETDTLQITPDPIIK